MNVETLLTVVAKELRLFLGSPIGYLFIAAYLGVTLFVFFWLESFFARNIADVRPMFEWLPALLIFLCSALTMRVWSDERRTGTLEFLVTLPVTSWELVLGKFLACLALLVLALLLTLPLPISVSMIGNLDWGAVSVAYFAAVLLGASYLGIGLFVSTCSENQIVTLIVSVFVCGAFYMLGSDVLTGFVGTNFADVLRELGSGSRFESITLGVLDLGDFYFYVSITLSFLVLNVFALKVIGWTSKGAKERHLRSSVVCGLVVLNLLVANFWVNALPGLRWDVTEGRQYTMSPVTKQEISQLQEPLLIRGYFSAKTHPLLAPLVPKLRDLITGYAVQGGRNVVVEFIDPATDPVKEDEANTKYGIRPVAFQVADRYQSSLVNSYFDILIRYGDEYEVLGFRELIEVKAQNETDIDVQLRNPEYDITRAISRVRSEFQSSGSIFDSVTRDVSFTGFVSGEDRLPEALAEVQDSLVEALEEFEELAAGKFNWQIVDPNAGDGSLALEIAERYGFQPMSGSLFDLNTFYFYLTLSDGQSVVSMALPESRDVEGFKRLLEEGIKRFAEGLLTSVAIHTPSPSQPQYAGQPQPTARFNELSSFLRNDYDVQTIDLRQPVASDVDVLIVVGPNDLDATQVFEIDQFLMRGGTVVIATSGFASSFMERQLMASPSFSGLDEWFAHHGVVIENEMVLDVNNGGFPIPVQREVGGLVFQDIQMIDYPFFIDVRGEGFVDKHPIVQNLDQMTFAWGSPISVDEEINAEREVIELLRSSPESWTQRSPDVMPKVSQDLSGRSPYAPGANPESELLAVIVQGSFSSFFEESPLLVEARERAAAEAAESAETENEIQESDSENSTSTSEGELDEEALMAELKELQDSEAEGNEVEEEDTLGVVGSLISQSPESSRLVILGSTDSLSDTVIEMISQTRGSLYVNNMQFVANVVDVSMEDSSFLSIRSRGHFNRTLESLEEPQQRRLEYTNYVLALLGLIAVYGVNYSIGSITKRRRVDWLGGNR